MKESMIKLKHGFGLAIRIIITVGIAALIIWKYDFLKNLDIKAIIDSSSSQLIAIGSVLAIYLLKGITFVIPASVLYIAIGLALDTWKAMIVNVVGVLLEFSISYLLGVILGGQFVNKKLRSVKNGEKLLSVYDKYENLGIVLTRVAIFPIDLNSVFLGSMKTPFLKYLGLSLLGIAPRLVLYTVLGNKIYDLIPYKYLLPAVLALVIGGLIAWTISYAVKSVRKEKLAGMSPYTPLCEEKRSVILETDMGPDCDDAGALAIMLCYLKKYDIKLLGICNTTSNPYANGCIRAICEYYGFEDVYIGMHSGISILPDNSAYNRQIVKKYCKYENSACASVSNKEFYSTLLKDAPDKSVTVISIGMLTNIAAALNEDSLLFNKKVHSIVAMAGKFPDGEEFNITTDPISFANVLEKFRNLIAFSGYETGKSIKTGFSSEEESNPVYDAYRLHCKDKIPCKCPSFDLTAVQYAFEGNSTFYSLSKPVEITADMNGRITSKKNKNQNRYYITKTAKDGEIEEYLNDMLLRKPAVITPGTEDLTDESTDTV